VRNGQEAGAIVLAPGICGDIRTGLVYRDARFEEPETLEK
jgi:hypothetical protein